MALDEGSRHEMFLFFDALAGEGVATTLTGHLPPVGWADVATRQDVQQATVLLRAEMSVPRS